MRRFISVVAVLGLLSVGLAGSAIAKAPGPPGFPLVPAVQATVKDECTGLAVPNLQVSISDGAGGTLAPTKLTTGAFQFATLTGLPELTGNDLLLSLGALGYQSLGDPASPNPGVTVERNPGPSGRVTKSPGPAGLPGETRVYEGQKWAITLMPLAGCATPRQPKPATLSAKVLDLATGAPIPAGTAQLLPDPGTPTAVNPGPQQISNGVIKPVALACGAYTMSIDAAGYNALRPDAIGFVQHGSPCDSAIGSGTATISVVAVIVLGPLGFNQPPVIQSMTADFLTMSGHLGTGTEGWSVEAYDPDPGETALLTYAWTVTPSTGVNCNVSAGTGSLGAFGCSGSGTASINVTVTDPHGATDTTGFTAIVVP